MINAQIIPGISNIPLMQPMNPNPYMNFPMLQQQQQQQQRRRRHFYPNSNQMIPNIQRLPRIQNLHDSGMFNNAQRNPNMIRSIFNPNLPNLNPNMTYLKRQSLPIANPLNFVQMQNVQGNNQMYMPPQMIQRVSSNSIQPQNQFVMQNRNVMVHKNNIQNPIVISDDDQIVISDDDPKIEKITEPNFREIDEMIEKVDEKKDDNKRKIGKKRKRSEITKEKKSKKGKHGKKEDEIKEPPKKKQKIKQKKISEFFKGKRK